MFNKKIIESASIVVLAAVLTVAGVNVNLSANTVVAEETSTENVTDKALVAGVSASLMDVDTEVTVVAEEVDTVTASEDTDLDSEDSADSEYTEEETKWLDRLMATTEDNLNVRADDSSDADVVGKLHPGDVATVVEEGDTWTKISSGNVEGYVLNEYCVFGLDALDYAEENVDKIAKVTIDGLRIRGSESVDGSVIAAVYAGDKLTVDSDTETDDGWVAVKYEGKTGYVAAEYVEVSYDLGKASTLQEEYAAEIAAQKAAAAAAAKSSSGQTSGGSTSQGASVSASADDATLIAAVCMLEAGGSYDGMLAVASVICNRVKSSSFPNTVSGVIFQSGQFYPSTSTTLNNRISNGVSSTALAAAKAALSGTDNTGGCLSFRSAYTGHAGTVIGGNVFF